jgi:antitoxin ParD1/3/4
MTFSLTPQQQAWLTARVTRGDYPSVADAVRQLIDDRIAEEGDDLDWAKPYVDEALAAVANGDVITREEHKARNAKRLAALPE